MESFRERIVLDYVDVCQDVQNMILQIKNIRTESKFVQLIGTDQIRRIKNYEDMILVHLREPFSLVVIGDFKRGKSTLINSLLGKSLAPTAVTPETATINRISYGESQEIYAKLENGKAIYLNREELKRSELSKLMEKLPSPIRLIEIKDNIEFLKEIAIVDTPGLGDLFQRFDSQVSEYLLRADAIVYVISARAPLSLSEQAFLSTAVMPQNFARVFVVVNMADTLETRENIEIIEQMVRARIADISMELEVFVVSAFDEYCKVTKRDCPVPELTEYLGERYEQFRMVINRDIRLEKDIIRTNRVIKLSKEMLDQIIARLHLMEQTLLMEESNRETQRKEQNLAAKELADEIEKKRVELVDDVKRMGQQTKTWMQEFMSRIRLELNDAAIDMNELERYLQFYLLDMTKQGITSCIERHRKEIADRLLTSTKELAGTLTNRMALDLGTQFLEYVTDVSWTGVDTAMFFADSVLNLSSVIGPLYLVGQAVAGFVREHKMAKKQKDYLKPILDNYDQICLNVSNNITDIYEKLSHEASTQFLSFYDNQKEAVHEALNLAKKLKEQEDYKEADILDYLHSVIERINDMKSGFEQ